MKLYVASSWRCERQPAVVAALRAAGHEVYDFKNPKPGDTGFSWKKILPAPPPWSAEDTRNVLRHPVAQAGFDLDFDAMKWADAFVMVQPCGRSAALELGWACGARKLAAVLLEDGQEPELMLKCADLLATSLAEVLDFFARWDPVAKVLRPAPDATRPVGRYRHVGTGIVGELVRHGAIGGAITLRFPDGSEHTYPADRWERLPEGAAS